MSWKYLGKQYEWTKNAKFQGKIDCICKGCQEYIAGLVKSGQLIEAKEAVLK